MSLAAQIGTAVGIIAAIGAAVSLWWGAELYPRPARRGYRWFAVAAALWGVGLIVGQALSVPAGSAAIPLSFADLPSLLALPVMWAGFARLAAAGEPSAEPGLPALPGAAESQGPGGNHRLDLLAGQVADGYVLAASLFLIGWVIVFGGAYLRAAVGPVTFTADLVHPLGDLALLGASLHLAVAAGRRGVLPYLALLMITVSDILAVSTWGTGDHPGAAALLAATAGLVLFALAPWVSDISVGGRRFWGLAGAGLVPGAATMAAAGTAGVAALVLMGWALAGGSMARPAVVFAAGSAVLALALRALGLIRRANALTWIWRESGQRFRRLADRTSDVVLLCDLGGVIRYASRAVTGFGYTPASLLGTPIADLLHPEDRAGGSQAVRKAVMGTADRVGRYPCRVRAADGTWRHVESTVSRYTEPGGQPQLLITARDMSAQVALRRQVTHLTFHDGLTGLPNRAYLEQRVREVGGTSGVTAVIFLDLDGFTAVNSTVGHSAGDLLLAQAGRRLRAAVPPQHTVARWGGDEFAVLIEGPVVAGEVTDLAGRLAGSIASPSFRAGDRDVSLTASVGVAFSRPDLAGHVWRDADMAMTRAKKQGGGRTEVFAGPVEPDEPGVSGGEGPDFSHPETEVLSS